MQLHPTQHLLLCSALADMLQVPDLQGVCSARIVEHTRHRNGAVDLMGPVPCAMHVVCAIRRACH